MASRPRYDQGMAHPEQQKYWFMIAGAGGAIFVAMLGAAAAIAGSAKPIAWTGPLMIVAYVAVAGVVAFFICGIRQLKFPLAKKIPIIEPPPPIIEPLPPVDKPSVPPQSGENPSEPVIVVPPDTGSRHRYLPDGPPFGEIDEMLSQYDKSQERGQEQ